MPITHCMSIDGDYAAAILSGEKTIECRKWSLRSPQTVAIATTKAGGDAWMPAGMIVGVMRVTACVPWRECESFRERAYMSDDEPPLGKGWRALMISSAAATRPTPVRGMPGLYKVPDGWEPEYPEDAAEVFGWWRGASRLGKDLDEAMGDDAAGELLTYSVGWRIDDPRKVAEPVA